MTCDWPFRLRGLGWGTGHLHYKVYNYTARLALEQTKKAKSISLNENPLFSIPSLFKCWQTLDYSQDNIFCVVYESKSGTAASQPNWKWVNPSQRPGNFCKLSEILKLVASWVSKIQTFKFHLLAWNDRRSWKTQLKNCALSARYILHGFLVCWPPTSCKPVPWPTHPI